MNLLIKKIALAITPLAVVIACSSFSKPTKISKSIDSNPSITNNDFTDTTTVHKNKIASIATGADNYNDYLPLLENKNVGIVTNQSGILSNKTHLVDFLLSKEIKL